MAKDKKKLDSNKEAELSDSNLNNVSGGAVQVDHVSSQGVTWYKVTNDKTGKVITTNSERRANELSSNLNDISWKI
ncbi:MAG: hypothetical protein RUMPE_01005 [Eubacteriales bacterium SKADARSKE-1]|nr:hypothetical protein [Eubacteriales bacterium SKADARSKE-1]